MGMAAADSRAPGDRGIRNAMPSIAILVIAILATFFGAIRNGFVWDDVLFIVRNPFLQDLSNLPKFFLSGDATGTGGMNPYYRPLTTATFAIDYAIWGERAAGFHLTNLIFHLTTTIALFFTARSFTHRNVSALAASLLFAVDPVQSEPVGYISARADLLCAFFMLAACLAYFRFEDSEKHRYLALSLAAFAMGLLSKIVALAIIPLLALHLLQFRRDRSRWITLIPFGVLALAFMAARSWVLKMETWGTDPILDRVANAGIHLVIYIKNAFVPVDLGVYYDFPPAKSPWEPGVVASWLFLLTVGFVLFRLARRCPAVVFGAGWFFVALVPVCGIFMKLYPTPIADRYLYIPLVGLAIAVSVLIEKLPSQRRFRWGKAALLPVVVACILAFSFQTAGRLETWHDQLTFWQAAAAEAPSNPYVINAYGCALRIAGNLPEAERTLKAAITLENDRATPYINLCLIELRRSNLKAAERYTLRALQLEPFNPIALNLLAIVKAEKGWNQEAILLFREAIRLNPYYTDARINLEMLLRQTKDELG
jgi:4-amino-4-deoxy-L-arabinose transferase-like glycosyltransferase